ncbi:LysM peptidoglycan-binding domain-containing protein [Marinobacter halodurans]|uniref:LysM peptidoglycan-binding domain-containing protein n=1 Tax=Marinobacter halodurans TaxID=2528979 RepID=A0ABY1ZPZ0_9GAMM|nr:LysM peptidoglycan-binding domain-containing protein [Marinobacter halodurans]TBW56469.1 LysM peptidoglycan-binding domain-containing protein [Marinobacter halodurans]
MRKLLYVLTAVLLFIQVAHAAGPELRSDHPDRYTVVKGDTLWDISSRFLDNPWYWPEIWHANPQVENPHLIYPGDVLALVYIDGQPRVTKVARSGNGVVKLSPKVRSTPIDTPVPTIPLDAIEGFLSDTRIVDPEVLDAAPYVLEGEDSRIVTGAGDRIYARGKTDADTLGVFRRSKAYHDPDTNEFLGLEAKAIGAADVKETNGEVLTLLLKRTDEEVRIGDRLLPTEDRRISPTFNPSAPDSDIDGTMIAVEGGVTQIGQYDVVVVNRGTREGLKPGNVLAVFEAGNTVTDPYTKEAVKLPDERAGLMMIFQTYEKMSYGLVLKASRTLAVGDRVGNP